MAEYDENCMEYLDQAPYGLFIFDRKGRILEVNPETCHVSGIGREKLLSMSVSDIISEKSKKEIEKHFNTLVDEGSSSGIIAYTRPDRRDCSLKVDAVKVRENRYIAFVSDVTEQQKTEADLKSRLRLEKIISSFSSSLTIIDSENIDQEIDQALSLLGDETGVDRIYFFTYSDDLVFFSNVYEWCSEGTEPEIDNLQNMRSSDAPWWTMRMKRNEPVMYENINNFPPEASYEKAVLDAQNIKSIVIIPSFYNGDLKGFIGFDSVRKSRKWTDEDVHLLRMAGNALCNSIIKIKMQKEKRKLEEKISSIQRLDSIGTLAGGVAHDFNNIMQIISGYAELAGISDSDSSSRYLEEIKKASAKASDLTAQLLAFARKQHVSPRSIDLNSFLRKSVSLLERLIDPDINIELKLESSLWPVYIDPSQVDQIITNLIINSRDSIKGKGSIIVETYNSTVDSEYCRTHPYFSPGDFAVLAVSDTGAGMNNEVKAHIFEPFYSTKPSSNSGLGLSTVYGIVKQNEGYIIVYSEEGVGSTFKVYLKKGNTNSLENTDGSENNSEFSVRDKNILVVEDEESILTLISRVLQKSSYNVVTAENGNKALEEVEKNPLKFDLLITDVVMPGMNGHDLNDRLREIYPEIKTIFMSGYTANIIADSGILDEGINFLQKPFSVNQLIDKVNEVFE